MLLYDGRISHISLELIDYAIFHEIIIACSPAHSSHLLQPLAESSNTEYHCGECGQQYMGTMKSYGLDMMEIVMAGTMLSALVFRKEAYQKTSTVITA